MRVAAELRKIAAYMENANPPDLRKLRAAVLNLAEQAGKGEG
jgi:hypothetical protein